MKRKNARALMGVDEIKKELEQGIEIHMYCGGGWMAEISLIRKHKTGMSGASFMSSDNPQARMWATAMNVLKATPGFELTVKRGESKFKLDPER
jgi:hypothetical protein